MRPSRSAFRAGVAAVVVAIVLAAVLVPLLLSGGGGTKVKSVASAPRAPASSAAVECRPLPFGTGSLPAGFEPQSHGSQLGLGQTVTVARGGGGEVDLVRGVSTQAFAVSVYSHGPVPLQVVTVLGQPSTLYPPGAGAAGPRVPFTYPAGGFGDACNRFQLQGVGVGSADVQAVAQGLTPLSS